MKSGILRYESSVKDYEVQAVVATWSDCLGLT